MPLAHQLVVKQQKRFKRLAARCCQDEGIAVLQAQLRYLPEGCGFHVVLPELCLEAAVWRSKEN